VHLCFLKQTNGNLDAFIHCIIENSPFTSSLGVFPTTNQQPWDLDASPDQTHSLQFQPGYCRRASISPTWLCWRLLSPGNEPALPSASWFPTRVPNTPTATHQPLTTTQGHEWYSLAFSARANCPAINHDSAVTAASAPMCKKGAVACRTQEQEKKNDDKHPSTPYTFIDLTGSVVHQTTPFPDGFHKIPTSGSCICFDHLYFQTLSLPLALRPL